MFDFLKKKIARFVESLSKTKAQENEEIQTNSKIEENQEKNRVKLSTAGTFKSIFTPEITLSENELKKLVDDFELELLEADVDLTVAELMRTEIYESLKSAKIDKTNLQSYVNSVITQVLINLFSNNKEFDFLELIRAKQKPLKIVFLGINGAGKTTTMAKIAKLFLNNNYKVVFAASDTFRAAAIEQLSIHADQLGIKLIKRDYGNDPTSVAYDAVNYARAHGIDVVMIDTAGRQDTNISLINEMKKMSRVIQPDLKVYVGESIAGNAIIEQVSAFNREIGIDSVILTKFDCDSKGGTMLSIAKICNVPISYIGTGQKYEDLEKFDATKIVARIMN